MIDRIDISLRRLVFGVWLMVVGLTVAGSLTDRAATGDLPGYAPLFMAALTVVVSISAAVRVHPKGKIVNERN